MRIFLSLLLATLSFPLFSAPLLSAYSASYRVEANGWKVGELTQTLSGTAETGFLFKSHMYTTGWASWFKPDELRETSRFAIDEEVLVPESYEYRYSGRNDDVVEKLDFDWQRKQVASLRDGKVTEVVVKKGVLEKQLYQIYLRMLLRKQAMEGELTLDVVDRGSVDPYRFRLVGEEQLDTELGSLRTVRIERLFSPTKVTSFWLAIERDYLLVQLEQHDDGDIYGSYITAARQ